MVLSEDDLLLFPLRHEEHCEVVLVVLIDLWSLVLMPDVLDGQGMEFEGLLEEVEVRLVRCFDVKPEPELVSFVEASDDRIGRGRFLPAGGGDQGSQGNAKCAATAPEGVPARAS